MVDYLRCPLRPLGDIRKTIEGEGVEESNLLADKQGPQHGDSGSCYSYTSMHICRFITRSVSSRNSYIYHLLVDQQEVGSWPCFLAAIGQAQ